MNDRKAVFDAVRAQRPLVFNDPEHIQILDRTLTALGFPENVVASDEMGVGPQGIALMHNWETCKLKAYPDPGSKDGKPWTIGWGATGPGIVPGVVWTQDQADIRFTEDLKKTAKEVNAFLKGTATSQEQFDALASFHYNTGKIADSTLGKLHRAGDFDGAAQQFGKWIYNDGKVMRGLINRRNAEAALYRKGMR